MEQSLSLRNRYIIKEPAGSGAYGTVVIAEDTQKGYKVAIKKDWKSFWA